LLALLFVPTTCKRNCYRKHEDTRDRRHNKHVSIHWLRPTARAFLFWHDTGLRKVDDEIAKNGNTGNPILLLSKVVGVATIDIVPAAPGST
jgi:hypothetical protein